MKGLIGILIPVFIVVAAIARADGSVPDGGSPPSVNSVNTVLANQTMQGQGYAAAGGGNASANVGDTTAYGGQSDASSIALGGESSANSIALSGDSTSGASSVALTGDSVSDSSSIALSGDSNSGAAANIITTSVSNYKSRMAPVTTYPPYLPYFQHGGWGSLQAYFPNGPTGDETVYERVFDPDNPEDMKELRGVLGTLSYKGPLGALGGVVNGVRVALGGPNNSHRGKGFEIANSLVRTKRPEGKPLLVLIDTHVDRRLLRQAGYAYVGKVGVEGDVSRNWDHVYGATVAEALPWDVDVLLVSGGMKGVTIGKNTTFPMAGGAYGQTDFSVSLFGGAAKGITEGKGEAMVSAEAYRYWPEAADRRSIPASFYDKVRARPAQMMMQQQPPQPERTVGEAVQETAASAQQTAKQTEAPAAKATAQTASPGEVERPAGKVEEEVPAVSAGPDETASPQGTAQTGLPGAAERPVGEAQEDVPAVSAGPEETASPQGTAQTALPGATVRPVGAAPAAAGTAAPATQVKVPSPGATAQKALPGATGPSVGNTQTAVPATVGQVKVPTPQKMLPGVSVSRQLLELSGYRPEQVQHMMLK